MRHTWKKKKLEGSPDVMTTLKIYVMFPKINSSTERNIFKTINIKKQIWINHDGGKTELSFIYSVNNITKLLTYEKTIREYVAKNVPRQTQEMLLLMR